MLCAVRKQINKKKSLSFSFSDETTVFFCMFPSGQFLGHIARTMRFLKFLSLFFFFSKKKRDGEKFATCCFILPRPTIPRAGLGQSRSLVHSILVSHGGGRVPGTRAISCSLWVHVSRKLELGVSWAGAPSRELQQDTLLPCASPASGFDSM